MSSTINIAIDDTHVIGIPRRFGKYEYIRTIGNGSFSAVVLCRHLITKATYACKAVSRELLVEQQIFDRFEQEVRVLQQLRHPNIVHVEEIVFTDQYIFLVMEYCEHGELFGHIVANGALDEIEAKRLFRQITEALSFVHEHNIAHRDLKPENILLDKDLNVKLADFGLCHTTSSKKLLLTPCGSPFYAPPEIINNVKYDGKKADVWSLGVVLYTMVTGALPWTEMNQTQLFIQIQEADIKIPPNLSPPLHSLLNMMLSREPKQRPSSKEVLDAPWMSDSGESEYVGTVLRKSSKSVNPKLASSGDATSKATRSSNFKRPYEVRPAEKLQKGSPQTVSLAAMPNIANIVRKVPPSGRKRVADKE